MVNGNSIRDIVHSMTKEELAGLIIELADQDPVLKSRLLALQTPVKPGQELKAYQKQFKAIAQKYGDRHGFITYGRSSAFTAEVGGMLAQARSARRKGLGLDLAFLVLENGLGALQYTDDSNGCIGDLAYEAVQTIKELVAAERIGEESSDRQLFDRLMNYTDSKELAEWTDHRQELLTIALDLAEYPALRKRLEEKLEGFIRISLSQTRRAAG